MNYRVIWTARALQELAAVWMAAADRGAINAAALHIEALLGRNPLGVGAVRSDDVRELFVEPLGVDYSVESADTVVWIYSTWTITP